MKRKPEDSDGGKKEGRKVREEERERENVKQRETERKNERMGKEGVKILSCFRALEESGRRKEGGCRGK